MSTTSALATKQKIAVLGGGMGSLSAVYALTNEPGWDERFEITIYQLGWRLGGKAATGRKLDAGARIEEHGYHTLFGFYQNTFAVMRDAYEKWGRDESLPMSRLIAERPEDEQRHPMRYALHREDYFIMQQQLADGSWHDFVIDFPRNTDLPGDGSEYPSPLAYLEMAIELLRRLLDQHPIAEAPKARYDQAPSYWVRLENEAEHLLEGLDRFSHEAHGYLGHLKIVRRLAAELAKREDEAVESKPIEERFDLLVFAMRAFLRVLWLLVGGRLDNHWPSYLVWTSADFICTCLIGIIEDEVFVRGFNSVDDVNFWEWIRKHGTVAEGTQVTNASMWIAAAYDSSFAYLRGDTTASRTPEKPPLGVPSMGAGTMLRGGLRLMLTYKGAMAWKFQAGCADVLCSPLYQLLVSRGVKFEFFCKVENLCVGGSPGPLSIDRVQIQRQVRLRDPSVEYQPIIEVKQVPCWPSEPLWDQIADADRIRRFNLESYWTPWPGVEQFELRRGADFDLILLGIPVGMLAVITPELSAASRSWKAMCEGLLTVRTAAIQTWMTRDLAGLGWDGPDAPVNVGVQPLDTWADMTQTLAYETWPEGSGPISVQYFCSAMRDDPNQPLPPAAGYEAAQTAWVGEDGVRLFETQSAQFWPKARDDEGRFDWSTMWSASGTRGPAVLAEQFIRANIDPNERYVLSVPSSVDVRLAAHGSEFANLYLAGDWTLNGLNVGCMEATVSSGLLASRAIAGYPTHIIGVDDFPSPR